MTYNQLIDLINHCGAELRMARAPEEIEFWQRKLDYWIERKDKNGTLQRLQMV